jgi:hypothetical protein
MKAASSSLAERKDWAIPVSIINGRHAGPAARCENGCYAETGALALRWIRYPGLGRRILVRVLRECRNAQPGPSVALPRQATCRGMAAHRRRAPPELVAANRGKNAVAFTHKPSRRRPVAIEGSAPDRRSRQAGHGQSFGRHRTPDRLTTRIAPVVTVLARAYARRRSAR